jgi:aspartyl-tRNA(Asn)/glutamyl-tRNA(Gln) amidotransferase subunit A
MNKPLHHYTATEIHQAFMDGKVTAVEIAKHFLKRIEDHKDLNAFLAVFPEKALIKAEQLDRKRKNNEPLGRLAAVPVGIKDNMHIAGELTTCASKFLSNYRAPFDATVSKLFEDEDALILGKTNLDEFAMGSSNENSAYGPVKNPWDAKCVAGGSSGGSAAAVSARLVLLATGSDTGGSIRLPAGFCGIAGFKPTYGRVSRYGLVAFGSSLDQIGPFATNIEDIAMTMEVIGQHCPNDATSQDIPPDKYSFGKDMKGVTFGVPYGLLKGLNEETRTNFDASVEVLKGLGAKFIDVDLSILKYSIAVYYILATAEASTNLARFDGIRFGNRSKEAKNLEELYELSRKEGFGKEVKRRILLGTYVLSSGFQDAYYKKAQKVRTLMIDAFEKAFDSCDCILTPVGPTGAFESGSCHDPLEMYLQDIFTIPANLAGLPSVALPSGFDKRGMPLSVQMTGPQLKDVDLLQFAQSYQKATNNTQIPEAFR